MELGLEVRPISLILKYVLQNCKEVRIDNKTLDNVQDMDFRSDLRLHVSSVVGEAKAPLVGIQNTPLALHYV